MVCLIAFLRVWKPKTIWTSTSLKAHKELEAAAAQPAWVDGLAPGMPQLAAAGAGAPMSARTAMSTSGHGTPSGGSAAPIKTFKKHPTGVVVRAWLPWLVLTVFVFAWGLPSVKTALNGVFSPAFEIG